MLVVRDVPSLAHSLGSYISCVHGRQFAFRPCQRDKLFVLSLQYSFAMFTYVLLRPFSAKCRMKRKRKGGFDGFSPSVEATFSKFMQMLLPSSLLSYGDLRCADLYGRVIVMYMYKAHSLSLSQGYGKSPLLIIASGCRPPEHRGQTLVTSGKAILPQLSGRAE